MDSFADNQRCWSVRQATSLASLAALRPSYKNVKAMSPRDNRGSELDCISVWPPAWEDGKVGRAYRQMARARLIQPSGPQPVMTKIVIGGAIAYQLVWELLDIGRSIVDIEKGLKRSGLLTDDYCNDDSHNYINNNRPLHVDLKRWQRRCAKGKCVSVNS